MGYSKLNNITKIGLVNLFNGKEGHLMNMWKRTRVSIGIGAMLCVVLTLTACGSGNKNGPDKTTLEQDLISNLTNYKEFLTLGSYEIEQSMTDDSNYTATIDVVAEAASGCAEYQFTADVTYTKYDQGWALDNCELTEKGYEIVEYPTEIEIIDTDNSTDDKVVMKKIDVEVYEEEDETVVCSEPYEIVEDQYSETGSRCTYYKYSEIFDVWNPDNIEPIEKILSIKFNKNIEGIWKAEVPGFLEDSTATISNVTDTSFDIYLPYFEVTCHVAFDATDGLTAIGSDGLNYRVSFCSSPDEEVYISITEDGVHRERNSSYRQNHAFITFISAE